MKLMENKQAQVKYVVERMYRPTESFYQNGERMYQTMVRYQQLLSCWTRQKKIAPALLKYYAYTIGEAVKEHAMMIREIGVQA